MRHRHCFPEERREVWADSRSDGSERDWSGWCASGALAYHLTSFQHLVVWSTDKCIVGGGALVDFDLVADGRSTACKSRFSRALALLGRSNGAATIAPVTRPASAGYQLRTTRSKISTVS